MNVPKIRMHAVSTLIAIILLDRILALVEMVIAALEYYVTVS